MAYVTMHKCASVMLRMCTMKCLYIYLEYITSPLIRDNVTALITGVPEKKCQWNYLKLIMESLTLSQIV